ncbi:hypothetical protein ANCCAN_19504, partial [Ancylostoma caninum]
LTYSKDIHTTEGTTSISGPDKNPDAPTTLWQALFFDDKQMQMQKFYKKHYGPVWETAKRREQEWKAITESKNTPSKSSDREAEKKIGVVGGAINISALLAIYRSPSFHNAFGILCASHLISDIGFLLPHIFWAAPAEIM